MACPFLEKKRGENTGIEAGIRWATRETLLNSAHQMARVMKTLNGSGR